jgi:hypothetical protein
MAMAEFLRHVQMAQNMVFSHILVHLRADSPLPAERETQDFKRIKKTARLWLSPQVVAGFNPDDFAELPTEQLKALETAVNGFRSVAEQAHGREPTTDEMTTAILHLGAIIKALGAPALDPEGSALMVAVHVSKEKFPDFVLGLDYTLDTDATGDPGIWIWVLIPDDVDPDSKEFREFAVWFPKAVRKALAHVKSDRLPYIHYRPLSEAVGQLSEGVA